MLKQGRANSKKNPSSTPGKRAFWLCLPQKCHGKQFSPRFLWPRGTKDALKRDKILLLHTLARKASGPDILATSPMMHLLVLKLHCSAIEVVVNADAVHHRHHEVVRTELVGGSLAMHESPLRPVIPVAIPPAQTVPLMESLAPTMVLVMPALPQPAVLLVPMVLSPRALPLTDDYYLESQRFTHGGSTRLHRTKQCSLFD